MIDAVFAIDEMRTYDSDLSINLSRSFAKNQCVSLFGQRAQCSADLALLSKLYTDSRLETLRVLYLGESGKIVSLFGLSTRIASCAASFDTDNLRATVRKRSEQAKRLGAISCFLIHERPSGIPRPSAMDTALSRSFNNSISGLKFQGHVVLGAKEFSLCAEDGSTSRFSNYLDRAQRFSGEEWRNLRILSAFDAVKMTLRMRSDTSSVTLITLGPSQVVSGISSLPEGAASGTSEELEKMLQASTLEPVASCKIVAVCREQSQMIKLKKWLSEAIYISYSGRLTRLPCEKSLSLPLYSGKSRHAYSTNEALPSQLPPLPAPLPESTGFMSSLFPVATQGKAFVSSMTRKPARGLPYSKSESKSKAA